MSLVLCHLLRKPEERRFLPCRHSPQEGSTPGQALDAVRALRGAARRSPYRVLVSAESWRLASQDWLLCTFAAWAPGENRPCLPSRTPIWTQQVHTSSPRVSRKLQGKT